MNQNHPTTIFDFVTQQETAYQMPIPMADNWEWSMKDHITKSTLYKNSKFNQGQNDGNRPFKNIVLPILNLQYRSEGFDVKDIVIFVNDSYKYFKSFLVKKYWELWARQEGLDTFIDELVQTYIDFGGVLVKKIKGARPEVVPFQSIAFCDQTDILSGPIGLIHFFSPDQLKAMEKVGWGDKKNGATISIDDLIILSREEKVKDATDGVQTKTPGKYIKVYEVHGTLPEEYLTDEASEDYKTQVQIVAFYQGRDVTRKQGVILFRKEESDERFKFLSRDPIYGRALGRGGIEELFDAQKWTNYDMIRHKEMLDAASKTILKTTDPTIAAKHPTGLKDMDNLEIVQIDRETDIAQLDTFPRNAKLFEEDLAMWSDLAQRLGSTPDALLGETPPSGTPFRLEERVVQEGKGLHEYRRGIIATFLDEIIRDWTMTDLVREIVKGQEFLSELELEELQEVADALVTCEANNMIKERILNGEIIEKEEVEQFKEKVREEFMKGGSKRFIKILKDEFKDAPMDVRTNIAGKQKNLGIITDKITNLVRFIFTTFNPQTGTFAAFDDPRVAKLVNQMLEYSDMSPIDFGMKYKPPQQMMQQAQPQQPTQQLLPAKQPAIV